MNYEREEDRTHSKGVCKGNTGFRIMGRHNHTSFVWVVGTFTKRFDADRTIDKVLTPMTGKAIIYRSEAF